MLSKVLSTRVWIILDSATFSYRIQKFSRSHIRYSTQIPLSTRIRWLVSGFTLEKLGLHVMPPFKLHSSATDWHENLQAQFVSLIHWSRLIIYFRSDCSVIYQEKAVCPTSTSFRKYRMVIDLKKKQMKTLKLTLSSASRYTWCMEKNKA